MFTPKKPEAGSSPALINLARILLGVAMLVLVLMIGLAYRNWSLYNSARAAGLRVIEVQNSLEALVSDLLDAESGRRGFLLTGEARYLEPCNRVIEAAPAELARLDK